MIKTSRSTLSRYLVALAAVGVATASRWALADALGSRQAFATYYVALLLAAWYGGSGPSLLAMVVSAAVGSYLFLPPFGVTRTVTTTSEFTLRGFIAIGSAIVLFGALNRMARLRLEREIGYRARAEATVAEQVRLAEFGRDVGIAIARSTDIRGMLALCSRAAVEHLDAAFARIWTLDDTGEVLELQASAGLYTHIDGPHGRVPVGMYKIGQIAQDRTPHLTNSVIGDPRVPAQEWARAEGMVAFAGYPLLVENRLVGVIAMFSRQALSVSVVRAIGAIANEIAVGIERKQSEYRLKRHQEWLKVTLASIGDGVIATDLTGAVSFLNPMAERLTGWSTAQATGKPLVEVFRIVNESTRATVENPAARALREGTIVGLANHTILVARDGTEIAIDDSAAPIRQEDGEIAGAVLVFRDVTQARAEQQDRERSEERFRALISASSQVVWTTTPDGTVTEDSSTWRAFTGQTYDQWKGFGWLDAIHPEDRTRAAVTWNAAIEQGAFYQTEYRVAHVGGGYRWTEARGVPVIDSNGTVREWVGMNTDITDQKVAASALLESHARVASILDSMTDACAGLDTEWRYTYVNRRWETLFDRKAADVVGRTIWEVLPETVGTVVEAQYRRAATERVAIRFEVVSPVIQRWVEIRAYPTDQGMASYISDIHDRKLAEAGLKLSEDRLRIALESAGTGTWDYLPIAGELSWDERTKAIFGLPPEATVDFNRDFLGGIHPDDLDRTREGIATILAPTSNGEYDAEYRSVGRYDGVVRWISSKGRVFFDPDRRPYRFIGTVLDITDRKRAAEELKAAKEEAEHANEAKSQFLAVLSHELRTPLNPILLAATAMLDRPAEPEHLRPTLEMIRQNVMLQARLIDDLLDVMRIVRGKMPLHWEVADCHRLINQAVQICRSEVFGKVLKLEFEAVASDYHLNADPARLQQVFWNLIKNAVKFTPEGGLITIRTSTIDQPGDPERRLVVEVIDTGIGIDPKILPMIFDPFQQGETTITRKFGGLGLGLAICKGIVEAHGGVLTAMSQGKGRGTTFRVVLKALPHASIEEAGSPKEGGVRPEPAYPSSLSILVVEDEPATLRLMARLLQGLGHTVTTASTITAGSEAFEAGAFDLIISDIGLPDGSGLELIRRAVAFAGPIPAIALTGYGMEEDIRRSREAGFTAHLTKPIDFTKLEAMIQQVAPVRP